MSQFRDAPIFDADQHMYEGSTHGHRLHPEPDIRTRRRAGAHEKFFAGANTEGLTLREMQGKAAVNPPEFTSA
jgi:hypothetical protein